MYSAFWDHYRTTLCQMLQTVLVQCSQPGYLCLQQLLCESEQTLIQKLRKSGFKAFSLMSFLNTMKESEGSPAPISQSSRHLCPTWCPSVKPTSRTAWSSQAFLLGSSPRLGIPAARRRNPGRASKSRHRCCACRTCSKAGCQSSCSVSPSGHAACCSAANSASGRGRHAPSRAWQSLCLFLRSAVRRAGLLCLSLPSPRMQSPPEDSCRGRPAPSSGASWLQQRQQQGSWLASAPQWCYWRWDVCTGRVMLGMGCLLWKGDVVGDGASAVGGWYCWRRGIWCGRVMLLSMGMIFTSTG